MALRLVKDTERLLTGRYTIDMARRLHSVRGEASVLAGWLAQDGGDTGSAMRLYGDVMAAAHLADDALLLAHACSNLAFVSVQAKQPSRAVQAARAGQRAALAGNAGPRLRALLAAREASGYAESGDVLAAMRMVTDAQRALDSARGEDPPWVAFVSRAEITGILGDVHSRLDRHRAAVTLLEQAAQMPHRPRNAMSWRLATADALIRGGDPEQGAALGSVCLPEVLTFSSARLRAQVSSLSRRLAPYDSSPTVHAFREEAREAGLAA